MSPRTPSMKLLREFYLVYLLQKKSRLTVAALSDLSRLSRRQTQEYLTVLEGKDCVAQQSKKYFLTAKGQQVVFLEDLD